MKHKNKYLRGFTLQELLVVIAIIGLLASVVMVNMSRTRAKSRNTNRLAGMLQMQVAIELYYQVNGRYPDACAAAVNGWCGAHASYGNNPGAYIVGLAPTYIPALPIDPSGAGAEYGYLYKTINSGADYKLMVYGSLEDTTVGQANRYYRCKSGCATAQCTTAGDPNNAQTYAVYSPGAACE